MRDKISYLIVHLMKKLMSDKGTSFNFTKIREGGSDCKNVKLTQDVRGKL